MEVVVVMVVVEVSDGVAGDVVVWIGITCVTPRMQSFSPTNTTATSVATVLAMMLWTEGGLRPPVSVWNAAQPQTFSSPVTLAMLC